MEWSHCAKHGVDHLTGCPACRSDTALAEARAEIAKLGREIETRKRMQPVDLGGYPITQAAANRMMAELDTRAEMIAAKDARIAELEKDRDRVKSDLEAPVELIQRWGCECEPLIGFTCGPCRVVELIDAALAAAKGE